MAIAMAVVGVSARAALLRLLQRRRHKKRNDEFAGFCNADIFVVFPA
jgi:hypothetical protein